VKREAVSVLGLIVLFIAVGLVLGMIAPEPTCLMLGGAPFGGACGGAAGMVGK
jgi:hypothetical protein